jgi:hypothetical protein
MNTETANPLHCRASRYDFWRAKKFGEMPKKPILVGTHHKTGTVWMDLVFRAIGYFLKIPFVMLEEKSDVAPLHDSPCIYFHVHSKFPKNLLDKPLRGLHLIRDPRDVVISAMHYHGKSEEPWLHEPLEKFGGLTYQQALLASKPEDRLLFEMQHASKETIDEMMAWNFIDSRFLNVRYEDLMTDTQLYFFRDIFRFLGFAGNALDVALRETWRHSIFAGFEAKKTFKSRAYYEQVHIRSGAPAQWIQEFTGNEAKHFECHLGSSFAVLKYPRGRQWKKKLRA